MDITFALKPNSEQLNSEDFLLSDAIYTVKDVTEGTSDQKLFIHLEETPGRTYRPGMTMRLLLALAWGTESDNWVGRRIRFYRDPQVKFGKDQTGGIRINGLSHITKPVSKTQSAGAGKGRTYIAEPLPDVDPAITTHLDAIQQADSIDTLKQAWQAVVNAGLNDNQQILAATNQRKAELTPKNEQEVQA